MASGDIHAESHGDPFDRMVLVMRMHNRREQNRIQDRHPELYAGRFLLDLEESHIERGIVSHKDRLLCKPAECRERVPDVRLSLHHGIIDPVDLRRFARNRTAGIDEPVECLVPEHSPVHNSHPSDRDDFIPLRGAESGRLRIERRKC